MSVFFSRLRPTAALRASAKASSPTSAPTPTSASAPRVSLASLGLAGSAGGSMLALSLPFFSTSSASSSSSSSSAGGATAAAATGGAGSASSTLFRDASPAAMRRQPTPLVFLSAGSWDTSHGREKWHTWIGYMREAGYDCIDMQVAVEGGQADAQSLQNETRTQTRLLSTQRQPLLFVRGGGGAQIARAYLSGDGSGGGSGGPGPLSGLVLVGPSSSPVPSSSAGPSDPSASEPVPIPARLNVAIVRPKSAGSARATAGAEWENAKTATKGQMEVIEVEKDVDGEQAMKEVERWMTRKGF